MSASLKLIAGAIALAIGGTAVANTTLDGTITGDVFINVVDATNGSSFLFDTGVSQATFAGGSSYSYDFHADPNYIAFLNGQKSTDSIDYSVFSSTSNGAGSESVLFTSSITVPTVAPGQVATAATTIGGSNKFLVLADAVTSSTSNSVTLSGVTSFGNASFEGVLSNQLLNAGLANGAGGYADDAALGTALAFYEDTGVRGQTAITQQTFAGTWNVIGGVATYTTGGTAPVPLPTPVLLLLSGLGLMGVVTRRSKTV